LQSNPRCLQFFCAVSLVGMAGVFSLVLLGTLQSFISMFISFLLHCCALDAPSEPRDLEITKFDKSSVTLKWKAPTDDGGNPIQGMCLPLTYTKIVMLHCKLPLLLCLDRGAEYCYEHVYVSVRKHISGTSLTLLCLWSWLYDGICHVLPVLWMTLWFLIMGPVAPAIQVGYKLTRGGART